MSHQTPCTATGTFAVKAGLAQMLKGGIIMDVVSAEQARIAEEAGVCAGIVCEYSGCYVVLCDSTTPSHSAVEGHAAHLILWRP